MKHFYPSVLRRTLAVMIAAMGFTLPALASEITLTIKADPAKISSIQIGASTDIVNGESSTYYQFSPEGVTQTITYSGSYTYFKVTPSDLTTKYTASLYKESGYETGTVASTPMKDKTGEYKAAIMSFANYNNGVLEILFAEEEQPVDFNVRITGDPSKVRVVVTRPNLTDTPDKWTYTSLVEGDNILSCMSSTDNVSIEPVGVDRFFSFTYNGAVKNPIDNMGTPCYQFTKCVKAGDVMAIQTDGREDVFYDFSISNLGDDTYKYITSLTVSDGKTVEIIDLATFDGTISVQEGKWVAFTADINSFYYKTLTENNTYTFNILQTVGDGSPKELPFSTGSYKIMMTDNTKVEINAREIVRDKKFNLTFVTDKLDVAVKYLGTGTSAGAESGDDVPFCDADCPVLVWLTINDSSTTATQVPWIYVNGELKAHSQTQLYFLTDSDDENLARANYLLIADGDEVNVKYEKPYMTVNVNDAAGLAVTNVEKTEDIFDGENIVYLRDASNADDPKIYFRPAAGYAIESILHNGTQVRAIEEGMTLEEAKAIYYSAKPANLDTYDITVRSLNHPVAFDNQYASMPEVYVIYSDKDGNSLGFTAAEEGADYIWNASVELLDVPATVTFTDNDASSFSYTYSEGVVYGPRAYTASFDNTLAQWPTVNAYVWNSVSESVLKAWPGSAMTKGADGSYSITFVTDINPTNIIFNNGAGNQTSDLDFEDGMFFSNNYICLAGSFNGWNPDDESNRLNDEGDGIYTITLGSQLAEDGVEWKLAAPMWIWNLGADSEELAAAKLVYGRTNGNNFKAQLPAGATLTLDLNAGTLRADVHEIYLIGDFRTSTGSKPGVDYVAVDHTFDSPDHLCPLTLDENGCYTGTYTFNFRTQPQFVFETVEGCYLVNSAAALYSESYTPSFDYSDKTSAKFSLTIPFNKDADVTFSLNPATRLLTIDQEDRATRVDELLGDETDAAYYTVDGVRVASPSSGLYIRVAASGKASKVLVK